MRAAALCRQWCALRRRLTCLLYVLASAATCVTVVFYSRQIPLLRRVNSTRLSIPNVHDAYTSVSADVPLCDSVFPGLLHGHWVPKNVSDAQRREMDEYLHQTRGEYKIPRTLERTDGRCGNLPYDGVPLYRFMWFRSLCNPHGPTPCCHNFQCTNRSVQDCTCPFCLDPRTPVHAELSHWLPASPVCRAREFGPEEACRLLRGTTLIMAGDSFVRHMFVALVMLLTNNFQNGALRKDADSRIARICQGMYQINGLRCRELLDQNRTLCNGTVTATYLEVFQVHKGRFLLPFLQGLVSRNERVLLLIGVGIHNDFRGDLVWSVFLRPLVAFFTNTSLSEDNPALPFTNSSLLYPNFTLPHKLSAFSYNSPTTIQKSKPRIWPKMMWLNTHAPGLLKTPLLPAQSFDGVRYYNRWMEGQLAPFGIPILDSFNMTAPLHSVDGTHYGYGANSLKVQFLLNWVSERQDRKEW